MPVWPWRLSGPISGIMIANPTTRLSPSTLSLGLLFIPLLIPQTMNANPTLVVILFDFAAPMNATWQVVNDDVMGGVSASSFRITNGVAKFRGVVSLENNGGFASVRSLPARFDAGDAGDADSFVIRVRGDGRRYKFTARMDQSVDSAIYQHAFVTKNGEWQELRLPLKNFAASFRGRVSQDEPPLIPAGVTSVGFLISDQQVGIFQLEIAWIKATRLAP